jgi:anti-sigma factor RsiW
MIAAGEVNDLEINAFIDGELAEEEAERVRDALSASEAVRERTKAYSLQSELLHTAYDPILRHPLPEPIAALLVRPPRAVPSVILTRIAAMALIGVGAAGVGYLAANFSFSNDSARAAQLALTAQQAHAQFVDDPQHPVEVAGTDRDGLSDWLGRRLGVELSVPDLTDIGYRLVGGRMLAEGASPAAFIMYEDTKGKRVTLFIEKWKGSDNIEIRGTVAPGVASYYWVEKPLVCAVTGGLEIAQLKSVAERLYKSLDNS